MKRALVFLFAAILLSGVAIFFISNLAGADLITVDGPYSFRDNRSTNSARIGSGDVITYGANSVVPNGYNGTTGVASQGSVTAPLDFIPFSTSPNRFAYSVGYNPSLTGQWNLTFTNGSDKTTVQTPSVGEVPQLPFASSVAISGSGLTPTFSWSVPGGIPIDAVRLQIWDLEARLPFGQADVIHAINFQGNPGSYIIPTTFSSGKSLQQGHRYSFEISLVQTRGIPLADNDTILNRSRSFSDFVPLPPTAPPEVFLPTVTPGPGPVYSFNTTVVGGQTIFFDPQVAIGYDYAIGPGDPKFASVTLPTGIGDNLYDLYLFNGTEYLFKAQLTGGTPYSFGPGGVDRFRILGIEASAGLDPNNTTAFITGLTFVGDGNFTGTMHPIIATVFNDVPIGYWADDFIMAIYDDGITTGCSQNPLRYCPEDDVTRGQMAAFIIRAKYGENFSYTATPYFTDVPSTHTFFKYVQKLKDDGITSVSGTYGVDNEVTRGQAAAFIIRAKYGENFTYTQTPYFTDVPSTHGFFKYVQKMKDEGITAVSGIYMVDNIVPRDQMAAFLTRAFLGMQ